MHMTPEPCPLNPELCPYFRASSRCFFLNDKKRTCAVPPVFDTVPTLFYFMGR